MKQPTKGRRYGRLKVEQVHREHRYWRKAIYSCLCRCGNTCLRSGRTLVDGGVEAMCNSCRKTQQEGKPNHMPTQREIAAMCAEIRESWSSDERRMRKCRKSEAWTVPVVKAPVFNNG